MSAIRDFRLQAKLTQAGLAEKLNISQGRISQYEAGGLPSPVVAARLVALSKSLGMRLSLEDIYCIKEPALLLPEEAA